MTGFMGNMGNRHEPIALIVGVIGVIVSVFFFLQKFNIISMAFEVTDMTYMYFFAGFTFFAGIILLFTTLGFIGVR
jgi:hypothetical protein